MESKEKNNPNNTRPFIKNFTTIFVFSYIIFVVFSTFPLLDYRGKKILSFSIDPNSHRFIEGYIYCRVFGKNTLNTEYGDIILNNFCRITVFGRYFGEIMADRFKNNQASHNLVIDGIQLPKDIDIIFMSRDNGQFNKLVLNHQNVDIYNNIFEVNNIWFRLDDHTADVIFTGFGPPEEIKLSDFTHIIFKNPRVSWRLYLHLDDKIWSLETFHKTRDYFLVKPPGENEFKQYTSITFIRAWGEFIEGELFAGE